MGFKLTEVVKTFIAVVNHLQGSNNFTEKLGISGMYRKYKKEVSSPRQRKKNPSLNTFQHIVVEIM